MKKIPLTQGKFALVDDEDYERLVVDRWFAHKDGRNFYACRNGRDEESGKRTYMLMHRQILSVPHGIETDHISGDGLDNRKSNLRKCSKTQNVHNATIRLDNSSGYKGVSRATKSKKWQAQIRVDGKLIHLGLFTCLIKAAKIYDTAARKYFGEFARTNFPA